MKTRLFICALAIGLAAGPAIAQDDAERRDILRSPLFKDATFKGAAGLETQWHGDPVTLSLRDADLVEVLRTFARLGDLNMILHPGIKGSVTVELKDVPWDQALSMILKINGLGMDITQGTLRVAPPNALRQMIENERHRPQAPLNPIYRVSGSLSHLDAVAVAELISRSPGVYLSSHGLAKADPATNTLTVSDFRRRLEKVSKMVSALDRPEASAWDSKSLAAEADRWWRKTFGSGS